MPKTNVYADKKTRWVDIVHPTESAIKFAYFFKTSVDLTEVTDLGQTEVSGLASILSMGSIAGTRRPTPLKVRNFTKRISTLCSTSKFLTAQASGWRRVKNSLFQSARTQNTSPSDSDRGAVLVTVPIDSNGVEISFGWFMQYQQFLKISSSERTNLGIKIPTNDKDWAEVVMGCNRVRPPRAIKTLFGGSGNTVLGGADTTETFYAVGSTLPAGWVHKQNALEFTL